MKRDRSLRVLFLTGVALVVPALAAYSDDDNDDNNNGNGVQGIAGGQNTGNQGTGNQGTGNQGTGNQGAGGQGAGGQGAGGGLSDQQTILLLPSFPGTNFLTLAAASSLLEIELGFLAQTNSTNADIQEFGRTLITDHTLTYQQAHAVAGLVGHELRGLSNRDRQIVQRLQALSGTQFDQQFIRSILLSHAQSISRFQTAAIRSWNWDVRNFAYINLPILLEHLRMALVIREPLLGNQPLGQPIAVGGTGTDGTGTNGTGTNGTGTNGTGTNGTGTNGTGTNGTGTNGTGTNGTGTNGTGTNGTGANGTGTGGTTTGSGS